MTAADTDTIAAIATAHGAGGIGIVRLSGPHARAIAEAICARPLQARHALHARFHGDDGAVLDDGIALYFAPLRDEIIEQNASVGLHTRSKAESYRRELLS